MAHTAASPPVAAPTDQEWREIEERHAKDEANEFTRRFFGQFHADRATLLRALKARLTASAATPAPPTRETMARALRVADGWPPSNWDGMTDGLREIYYRKASIALAFIASQSAPAPTEQEGGAAPSSQGEKV